MRITTQIPLSLTEAITFSQYGIVDFKVPILERMGLAAVTDGVVTGNNKVWRKFNFSNINN